MKYYIALFQKIKEYSKTLNANPSEIALICPSLHVYKDSELKLLLPQLLIADELKGEALLKKQDMSFQLNSLPASDQYWDVNPANTLFDVYGKLINSKQEPSAITGAAEIAAAQSYLYLPDGKPTKQKKAYDKYLGLFDGLLMEWEQHLATFNDLQTDDEKTLWIEKLNVILLKKEKMVIDFKLLGFKKEVETAFAKINKMDEFDAFLSNLISSRNIMDASQKTGIQSMESYHDINFVPYDFMSGSNGWLSLSVDKKELDVLYEAAQTEQSIFQDELLSFDYDEQMILGIELEFSIVTMQRNWFSLASLVSDFFKWNEPMTISDGQTISNAFLLSAYPKRMILIKNLKINLDPNVKQAEVSNLDQIIYFGPIVMKNQLFVNAGNNTRFIKAIRNKDVLASANVKYFRTKAAAADPVSAPVAATAPAAAPLMGTIRTSPVMTASIRTRVIDHRTPQWNHLVFNPGLFHPVVINPLPVISLATVVLAVKDSVSGAGIYKSEISIMGVNNKYFKEIESDQEGTTNVELPVGNYTINIQKDGYKILEEPLNIENLNTLSKNYSLIPESVTYDSFFLIGMICEKLPKIPK